MAPYRTDLINDAMNESGHTNESLAHKTGLSHATISAVRNGKANVQLATLRVIVKELKLRLEDVVAESAAA
jgi:DNA-binding Xre family transcriptional regulator